MTLKPALQLFSFIFLGSLLLTGCLPQQTRTDPQQHAEPDATHPQIERVVQVKKSPAAAAASHSKIQPPAALCESPQDIWERIRLGMSLPDRAHPGTEGDLKWFAKQSAYLDRVFTRAVPYLYLIVEAIEERKLPTELALLPVVESAFQPFAYSHGRAAGLWQFIPSTGERFNLKQNWWYDGRRDVLASTHAALDYMEYLHDHFEGEWLLAIAAYNSGEGTVKRAVARNKAQGKPTDFWSLKLPRETQGYVPKLLAIAQLVKHPEQYDIALSPIANDPFLASVKLDSQIDLSLAAELADLSLEEIYLYNPGFNRWATDPGGPHRLLLPIDRIETFEQQLASYPAEKRVRWQRHRIKPGESLMQIAQRYHTTVDLLKNINKLRSNAIRAGDTLTIPVARTSLSNYSLSADQRLSATQNQPRSGQRTQYTVKSGDSLWGIAQRHGVGVNELAQWNGMAPRDPLMPGKKLVVWAKKAPAERVAGNPANFTHPYGDTAHQRIGYTVRRGDSLHAISQRFRVSVDKLVSWNKLDKKKYLQPGQRLTLYVDVTQQAGNM